MGNKNPIRFFIYISTKPDVEKIVFGPTETKSHATMHLGTKSKCLDIHITTEESPKKYKQIFKIEYSTITELFNAINNNNDFINSLCKFYTNFINLGKLKKHNSYVISAKDKSTIESLFSLNQAQTRIKTKKEINDSKIENLFQHIEECNFDSDNYVLFKLRNNFMHYSGLLFKRPNKNTSGSFIFLSRKRMNELAKFFMNFVLDKLQDLDTDTHNSLKKILNT